MQPCEGKVSLRSVRVCGTAQVRLAALEGGRRDWSRAVPRALAFWWMGVGKPNFFHLVANPDLLHTCFSNPGLFCNVAQRNTSQPPLCKVCHDAFGHLPYGNSVIGCCELRGSRSVWCARTVYRARSSRKFSPKEVIGPRLPLPASIWVAKRGRVRFAKSLLGGPVAFLVLFFHLC